MHPCTCCSRRTPCESWFSPSSMWVPRMELRSGHLLSHLAGLNTSPFNTLASIGIQLRDTDIQFVARDCNYHNQVCWESRARTGNGQELLLRGDGQRIGSGWKGGIYPGKEGAERVLWTGTAVGLWRGGECWGGRLWR